MPALGRQEIGSCEACAKMLKAPRMASGPVEQLMPMISIPIPSSIANTALISVPSSMRPFAVQCDLCLDGHSPASSRQMPCEFHGWRLLLPKYPAGFPAEAGPHRPSIRAVACSRNASLRSSKPATLWSKLGNIPLGPIEPATNRGCWSRRKLVCQSAGKFCAGCVDGMDFIFQSEFFKCESVGAKGVCLDHIHTCFKERRMDFFNRGWKGQIKIIVTARQVLDRQNVPLSAPGFPGWCPLRRQIPGLFLQVLRDNDPLLFFA